MATTLNLMEYSRDHTSQKSYKITGHHPVTFHNTARLDDPIRKWGSGSLYLDGDSDSISAADHADWDLVASNADDWTIDMWVRHTDHDGDEYYMTQFQAGDQRWLFSHNHGTGLRFEVISGVGIIGPIDGGEITDSNWHHIALCKVASKYGLYLDGIQTAYTDDASTVNFTGSLYIGQVGNGGAWFDGHMDEVRIIHSNVFGAAPANAFGNGETPDTITVPTGPHTNAGDVHLLLHFEGLLLDDGDTGHTITPVATAGTTGVFDEHLWLDGDSDYLSAPNSADWDVVASNADNWTIDFWVRHTDHANTEVYLTQDEDGTNYWLLYHVHGSGLKFIANNGGGVILDTGFGGEIADSCFHHIAMCKVGSDYGVYLDGTQVNHTDDSDIDTFAALLYIGANQAGANFFQGQMDDIRIIHSNIFSAAPNATPDDTITVPISPHQIDTDTKLLLHCDGLDNATHAPDSSRFEPYSEDTIVNEGTYSLKNFAEAANSLNDVIKRVITPTIDLTDLPKIKLAARASRTGTNIQAQFKNQPDNDTKLMLSFDGFNGEKETLDRCASPKRHQPITFAVTAQLDTEFKKWGTASLMLDGDSDYLTIPDSADWDVVGASNDDWTIDFWVKHDDHAGSEHYLFQWEGANDYWGFRRTDGEGIQVFLVAGGLLLMNFYGEDITDTNWHHLALCKVGSKYAIYKDGTQIAYLDSSATANFVGTLYIGAQAGPVNFMDGHMDEIRIHHSNIFNADPQLDNSDTITEPTGEHTPDANTKLLLHLNGADTAQTTDDAAFGHEITFIATSVISNAQRKWGGTSILFDGDSDYLTSPDSEDWNIIEDTDDWVVELFVRHDDHDGTECYVTHYEDGTNWWALFHEHGAGLYFEAQTGGQVIVTNKNGEITDSNWHHVLLAKVGTEYGIYLDGTQVCYVDDASVDTYAGLLYIGAFGGPASYFDGHMEELRIYEGNPFGAAPANAWGNGEAPDTITPPTAPYDRQTHDIVILAANTWQTEYWDIDGIANANKDEVDRLYFEIIEASADNTFYLDNMFGTMGRIFITHQ